jgi:hypothetical protein
MAVLREADILMKTNLRATGNLRRASWSRKLRSSKILRNAEQRKQARCLERESLRGRVSLHQNKSNSLKGGRHRFSQLKDKDKEGRDKKVMTISMGSPRSKAACVEKFLLLPAIRLNG